MIKVLDEFKLKKQFTEEEYIELLNKALKGFIEDEICKGEIVALLIESSSAEELFNKIFDDISYKEYREIFNQDEKWGEEACDIIYMLYLIDNIGDSVCYNINHKEFYLQ